ncbi:hypothetical protein C8F04DRAFT_959286, partial [Mycena alexandri]
HLHKINKADSPLCPGCRQADETVEHYLLRCPAHADARRELVRAGGPRTRVLTKLLRIPELFPHLFRYLGRTGRFHTVHGVLPEPPAHDQPTREENLAFFAKLKFTETVPRSAKPFNTRPSPRTVPM